MRRARLILLAIALTAGGGALAQTIADERAALIAAKEDAATALERAKALEVQASEADNEAERMRADAAAVAGRIQAAEADIEAAETRVRLIEMMRTAQRQRLAEKQKPAVRLVAALQMMARRPPALALVQPGTTSDMVHVRAMLATMLPAMRARTAGLRAEIARSRALRENAQKAVAIREAGQDRLEAERVKLTRLAAQQRAASQKLSSGAMLEQDRALALGEKARDIGDLIVEIGAQTEVRASLESLPGPLLRPDRPGAVRNVQPELAQDMAAPPDYRLPVDGRVLAGLGEVSDAGIRARGLSIAARGGAQVVAPAAGRIAFADIFRSYGRVVIIDHGRGWTTLLTGLSATDVRVGDTIVQGSPVGRVRNDPATLGVELRQGGTPVDIASLIG